MTFLFNIARILHYVRPVQNPLMVDYK